MSTNLKPLLSTIPIPFMNDSDLIGILNHFKTYNGRLIGQILVAMGTTTQELVDHLEVEQKAIGRIRIGELLLRKRLINREQLNIALAAQAGKPWLDVSRYKIPQTLIDLIPHDISQESRSIPLFINDGVLFVAKESINDDLFDPQLRALSQNSIRSVGCSGQSIDEALRRNYGRGKIAIEALRPMGAFTTPSLNTDRTWMDTRRLVIKAVESQASDIHLRPTSAGYEVYLRVNGELVIQQRETPVDGRRRIAQLKAISGMDNTSSAKPQDGRLSLESDDHSINLRISCMPAVHGETVAIRVHDKSQAHSTIRTLGYTDSDAEEIERMLNYRGGLILVSGPTGSGKTSTVYTAMRSWIDNGMNVLTAEDPVEYIMDGIQQIEIDEPRGRNFASVLRNIIRHDPDCCMVGEVRDEETASIVCRAAMTGRTILSTVHANDGLSTIERLADLGYTASDLASVLIGIVSQRLVPRLCMNCRLPIQSSLYYQRGAGCSFCNGTGFDGRQLVYEIIKFDRNTRAAIRKYGAGSELSNHLFEQGMVDLEQRAIELAAKGIIALESIGSFLSRDPGMVKSEGANLAGHLAVIPHRGLAGN